MVRRTIVGILVVLLYSSAVIDICAQDIPLLRVNENFMLRAASEPVPEGTYPTIGSGNSYTSVYRIALVKGRKYTMRSVWKTEGREPRLIMILGYDPTLKSRPSHSGTTSNIALNTSGSSAGEFKDWTSFTVSEKSEGSFAWIVYVAKKPGESTNVFFADPADPDDYVRGAEKGVTRGQVWSTPLYLERDPEPAVPSLGNIVLALGRDPKGFALGPSLRFPASTGTIHAVFGVNGVREAPKLSVSVMRLSSGEIVLKREVFASLDGDIGDIVIESPSGSWRPGWYKVTIGLGPVERHELYFLSVE
jgi:hypothetical protein